MAAQMLKPSVSLQPSFRGMTAAFKSLNISSPQSVVRPQRLMVQGAEGWWPGPVGLLEKLGARQLGWPCRWEACMRAQGRSAAVQHMWPTRLWLWHSAAWALAATAAFVLADKFAFASNFLQ